HRVAPESTSPHAEVISAPESSHGHWWCGVAAHLGVPVGPRTGVDYPGWRTIECFPQVVIREVAADDAHVLVHSVGHRIRPELHRISKCLLGRLEPNDPPCNFQHDGRYGDRVHNSWPKDRTVESMAGKWSHSGQG